MALEKSAKTHEQNKLSVWIAAVVVGILIVVIMVACAGLLKPCRFEITAFAAGAAPNRQILYTPPTKLFPSPQS